METWLLQPVTVIRSVFSTFEATRPVSFGPFFIDPMILISQYDAIFALLVMFSPANVNQFAVACHGASCERGVSKLSIFDIQNSKL